MPTPSNWNVLLCLKLGPQTWLWSQGLDPQTGERPYVLIPQIEYHSQGLDTPITNCQGLGPCASYVGSPDSGDPMINRGLRLSLSTLYM